MATSAPHAAGGLADAFGDAVGAGVQGVPCSVGSGRGEPVVEGVDRGDPGAVELSKARGEEADHTLAEYGDVLAEVDVGSQYGVVRDGADPGEGPCQRFEPGGQCVSHHALGRHDALAAVTPDTPDHIAGHRHSRRTDELGETSVTSPTSE